MKTNLFFRRSGHFRVVLRVCVTLSAVFCLAACGQKGPLYLPKSAPTPPTSEATKAQTTKPTPSQPNNAPTSP